MVLRRPPVSLLLGKMASLSPEETALMDGWSGAAVQGCRVLLALLTRF